MHTSKSVLLLMMVTALVTFFTSTEAWAAADGNGACSAAEVANFDCTDFEGSGNVLEFRGQDNGTCSIEAGGFAPCTAYFYSYSGTSQNQLVVGIPTKTTAVVSTAQDTGCSQYITDGSGDPTTGYLENVLGTGACRIANSLASLPGDITPPNPPADFVIFADPSFHDPSMANPWQLRMSKQNEFAAQLNGPTVLTEPIFQTGVTFTSATGDVCTVNETGIVDCPGAREVTLDQMVICAEIENCATPGACQFPSEYECDTVAFTGTVLVKAGLNTNCWIGPYSGRYYWGNYC